MTRRLRDDSFAADTPATTPERGLPEKQELEQIHIPAHYLFLPTYPSPFEGTLEASLDALLDFGRSHPDCKLILDVLRQPVDIKTNWMGLLSATLILEDDEILPNSRLLLEELLLLATRKLLPEQIAQNRALMYRMYDARKTMSMRMILRYDLLYEWIKRSSNHFLVIESRPPVRYVRIDAPGDYDEIYPGRTPLLPNVWATLIAAPALGYATQKMREAMKHHVTALDGLLMVTDEEVEAWNADKLFRKTAEVLLQWQWLRKNTELMEDMEVRGWEDLEGPAGECEWVRDPR